MIAHLCDVESVSLDLVHKAVLIVDPSRPVAGQGVLQRFRLSGAPEGVSVNLFDEGVDPLQSTLIGLLPIEVVFP